ncbi:SOS response-associated peptidase [Methylococcus mesophilus]|uniref:SOS response-associated peptidase n=1 Tax=Methylococcus mesophilus TaxID=2993564 RepID=UPI00224AFF2C|nr:SOS response-associated peptidase [Methylococcus mesophilus]UZR27355.1 SOS response-associated peptidase [Methylococcus mesophilus]
MCGRYSLKGTFEDITENFKVDRRLRDIAKAVLRYNIAPSQQIVAVRTAPDGLRELVPLKWGLLPSWSKEPKAEYSTINARAETVAEKPAYRAAFKHRRCLIPADGFYEWQARPGFKLKQPWYIQLTGGELFAFAGLWERWEPRPGQSGEPIETCTIIVTDANALMRPIHDRMPVILDPAAYDVWLDPAFHEREALQSLLRPYPADEMTAWRVSTHVNGPKNDDAACLEPIEEDEG